MQRRQAASVIPIPIAAVPNAAIVHAPMHPVANAIPTPIAADRNAVAVNVLNPSLRFEMP